MSSINERRQGVRQALLDLFAPILDGHEPDRQSEQALEAILQVWDGVDQGTADDAAQRLYAAIVQAVGSADPWELVAKESRNYFLELVSLRRQP